MDLLPVIESDGHPVTDLDDAGILGDVVDIAGGRKHVLQLLQLTKREVLFESGRHLIVFFFDCFDECRDRFLLETTGALLEEHTALLGQTRWFTCRSHLVSLLPAATKQIPWIREKPDERLSPPFGPFKSNLGTRPRICPVG